MIVVRPARPGELEALRAELERGDRERVDLAQCRVLVAEDDGELLGFTAARVLIQLEPLHVMDAVRAQAPHNRLRRIALALARAMDKALREAPWAMGGYYAYVRDPVMQRLAKSFGFREVYGEGKWFLREWRR